MALERAASSRQRATLITMLGGAVLALAALLSGEPSFERGVVLGGSTLPKQAGAGERVKVAVELRPAEKLPPGAWSLVVHTELRPGLPGACDLNERASFATPPAQWPASQLVEEVELTLPPDCAAGPVEFWVGLYDATTGDLLPVARPRLTHERLFLGTVEVVQRGADATPVTRGGAALIRGMWLNVLRPWAGWAFAVVLALAWATKMRGASTPSGPGGSGASTLLAIGVFLFGAVIAVDFFKDDAFISFRYAKNLADGHGLVFNPGERVEGITNPLWTVLFAPFTKTSVDLVLLAQLLGVALGVALIVLVARAARALDGPPGWAALLLASSSTLAAYAVSGMESTLAALLPFAAALLAWTQPSTRRALAAGLLAAGGCMTRPELHVLAGLVSVPLLVEAARTRRVTARLLAFALALGVPLLAFHAARFAYYGSLLPNTYFAKTGTGDLVWRAGLELTREMLGFNGIGLLWLLTPFAFLAPTHRLEKGVMLAVSAYLLVFQLRVGSDEMDWFRLYLPALPFLATLGAMGLQAALSRVPVPAVGWGLVLLLSLGNVATTWKEHHGLDGYRELLGRTEAEIGRYLARHSKPGALVAAQDMGSAPFHAPGLRFFDFIGLVEPTVARTRHELGLHAFVSEGRAAQEREFNRRMQALLHERAPEWVLLSVYPPAERVQELSARFAVDPTPAALGDTYALNAHHFGLWEDPKFHERYVPVKAWRISKDYYVSAFSRRDVWEETPREVVFDAPPAELGGVKASFGDLALMGSELPEEPVVAQHAAVVTTWWKVPGPRSEEAWVSLTLSNGETRVTERHALGDSRFPAQRWREGLVVKDEVAWLLPPEVTPGTWKVEVEALGQRVALGEIVVRELRVGRDRLIGPSP